jgi:hypothetical protein
MTAITPATASTPTTARTIIVAAPPPEARIGQLRVLR